MGGCLDGWVFVLMGVEGWVLNGWVLEGWVLVGGFWMGGCC